MNVQELIDTLSDIKDKSSEVYMRIGGLPLMEVGMITIEYDSTVILSDYE